MRTVFTDADKLAIYASKEKPEALAERYDCTVVTILRIRRFVSQDHVRREFQQHQKHLADRSKRIKANERNRRTVLQKQIASIEYRVSP